MLFGMTDLSGVHHVALTVRDLEVSVAWYAAVLGFEELFREDGGDHRACIMRSPDGSVVVGIGEHDGTGDEPFDPRRLGLDHLAFTVSSRAALDEWERRLTEAGVTHSGVIEIPLGGILNFKDPDDLALALFWDR
jgi:glyoxylase I family protein